MTVYQLRGKGTATGRSYVKYCPRKKKRQYAMGSLPAMTGIGERQVKMVRTPGGGRKARLLREAVANIYDPKTKKHSKAKIKTVTGNPANRHFVRRNIITKGAIIDTEAGKARVTSRPGQDGMINAVLV
jgi:small subunit ribosomal protein S8e